MTAVEDHCDECDAIDGTHTPSCTSEEAKAWRTHHEPGSAEETFSRRVRFDKYYAMQHLLNEIANAAPSDNHAAQFQPRAREILRDMIRPRTPAVRAKDRATELETLVLAYHLASGVFPVESPHLPEARTLITEALKAWERDHPPAALDPALL